MQHYILRSLHRLIASHFVFVLEQGLSSVGPWEIVKTDAQIKSSFQQIAA